MNTNRYTKIIKSLITLCFVFIASNSINAQNEISGYLEPASGSTETYTLTGNYYNIYGWSSSQGTIISSSGSDVTINWTGSGAGYVEV